MTTVPDFIVKGAKILTFAANVPTIEISPSLIRNIKFDDISNEEIDIVSKPLIVTVRLQSILNYVNNSRCNS
jgi:hypothetical protein